MPISKRIDFSQQDDLETVAAEWLARRDAGLTSVQQKEFDAWRAADPAHANVWAKVESAWLAFDAPGRSGAAESMVRAAGRTPAAAALESLCYDGGGARRGGGRGPFARATGPSGPSGGSAGQQTTVATGIADIAGRLDRRTQHRRGNCRALST